MAGEWHINLSREAQKSMDKIPQDYVALIKQSLIEISIDPFVGDIKKMAGEKSLYRKRIASYRIIYRALKDILYIEVIEVSHRQNAYK